MPLDPIHSDPKDYSKALENWMKTGEMEVPLKEKWKTIIQLKNEFPYLTNQQIANKIGYKMGQSVADELVKIRRHEKKTGIQLLKETGKISSITDSALDTITDVISNPVNSVFELAALWIWVKDTAKRDLPFKGVPTRAGISKEKFNELWKELNDAGFQEDGTLWQGMVMPTTGKDFKPDELMSYVIWLANHPDQLPDIELDILKIGEQLVHALCAIAIVNAKSNKLRVLASFKPYDVPKEHRNKQNTERALEVLEKFLYR